MANQLRSVLRDDFAAFLEASQDRRHGGLAHPEARPIWQSHLHRRTRLHQPPLSEGTPGRQAHCGGGGTYFFTARPPSTGDNAVTR
jgi:hypothetical protein